VVRRLRKGLENDEQIALEEFYQIREQLAIDTANMQGTMFQELTKRHNLKRLALGFATMFFAQCTGTLVINSKSYSAAWHLQWLYC
jgi:hypothetical protein